nr:ATP-binding protein [Desulfovibrio sp. JC022]
MAENHYVPSVITCIGANASGKSNLISTLIALLYFMTDRRRELAVDFFKLHKDIVPVSDFELMFEISNTVYRYSLGYNRDGKHVEYEELYESNPKTGRWNYIFKRELDDDGEIQITKGTKAKFSIDKMKRELEDSESLLAVSSSLKHETGFEKILEGLSLFFAYKYNNYVPVIEATKAFKDLNIIDNVSNYLKSFDVGIERIEHSEIEIEQEFLDSEPVKKIKGLLENMPDESIPTPKVYTNFFAGKVEVCEAIHEINGVEYRFDINLESDGTKQLIKVLFPIIAALTTGGVAIIDKIEVGLHPIVVEEIIELFRKQSGEELRGQLICSSHSVNVINQLSKRQIVLVEKDRQTLESQAWFLNDVKDVKERDNFFMNYITGKYGAIPQVN